MKKMMKSAKATAMTKDSAYSRISDLTCAKWDAPRDVRQRLSLMRAALPTLSRR